MLIIVNNCGLLIVGPEPTVDQCRRYLNISLLLFSYRKKLRSSTTDVGKSYDLVFIHSSRYRDAAEEKPSQFS